MKAVIETTPLVRDRIKAVARKQGVTSKDLATLILDDGLERFERGEVTLQKETVLEAIPAGKESGR